MIVTLLMIFTVSGSPIYETREYDSYGKCLKAATKVLTHKQLSEKLVGLACVEKLEKKRKIM